jgi:hypothetical protein
MRSDGRSRFMPMRIAPLSARTAASSASTLIRSRRDDLRSLALCAGARPQARRPAQWRSLQGLGAADCDRAHPAQIGRWSIS